MKDVSASKAVWQQDDVLCQKLLLSERGEGKMSQHRNPMGKKGRWQGLVREAAARFCGSAGGWVTLQCSPAQLLLGLSAGGEPTHLSPLTLQPQPLPAAALLPRAASFLCSFPTMLSLKFTLF